MRPTPVYRFAELPSTQEKAFELLSQGEQGPFWVVAENQTRGRGRLQREWKSEPGKSFTGSFAFRAEVQKLEGLSLVVGLGVLKGIDQKHGELRLKWPNDLMLQNEKVGGILIESKSQDRGAEVVVGIGLNFFEITADANESYQGLGGPIDEQKLFLEVENQVSKFLSLGEGFLPFRADYLQKIWGLNQEHTFKIHDSLVRAKITGINEKGYLETERGAVLQLIDSGEIVEWKEGRS